MSSLFYFASLSLAVCIFLGCTSISKGQSGCVDLSNCICPTGSYYNDSSLNDDEDTDSCCPSCNSSSSNDLTAGSGGDCMSCDRSCDHCYGPYPNHCHSCDGPFIVLERGREDGQLVCQNGLIRNTSLDIVQCLDNCTNGFTLDNDTMECKCDTGRYRNGTMCMECTPFCSMCVNGTVAGCLMCSVVSYNGVCMEECPPDTAREDRLCIKGNQRFLSITHIIAIIAGIAGGALILFILTATVLCLCIYRSRAKHKHFTTNDVPRGQATVVISESFKKVSLKKSHRINKSVTPPADADNPVFLHNLRHSFDPYHHSIDGPTMHKPSIVEEGDEGRTRESFYVEMSPATSQEQLETSGALLLLAPKGKAHRKVGPSHSFQSPSDRPPYPRPTPRNSLPPVVGSYGATYEEMTVFANSPPMSQDEEQETYEDLSAPLEMYEDLQAPTEVYEDFSAGPYGPPIPQRSVVPPPKVTKDTNHSKNRKETLDNQYVKVNRDLTRNPASTSQLLDEPEYVNVSRHSRKLRQRSITSPDVTFSEETEPDYENWELPTREGHLVEEEVYI